MPARANREDGCGVAAAHSIGQEKAGGARDDQELAHPLCGASDPAGRSIAARDGRADRARDPTSACGLRGGGAVQSRPPQHNVQAWAWSTRDPPLFSGAQTLRMNVVARVATDAPFVCVAA
jgi:hypothetical protein